MTTNGTLLDKLAWPLKDAGLMRINISLDSLKKERYNHITQTSMFERVMRGIQAAKEAGFDPIKINMVLLKGINTDEIFDMIEFCKENGFILQLIELIDTNVENKIFKKYHVNMNEIEDRLKPFAEKVYFREMQNRPVYIIDGTRVEIVKPMHNPAFCQNCTRLRMTYDGRLKPCLMDMTTVPLDTNKIDDKEHVMQKILEAIDLKEPFFKYDENGNVIQKQVDLDFTGETFQKCPY